MYPSAPQSQITLAHSFKCVIRSYKYNGFAETIIVQDDDETFYARQKERLQKAHPTLTDAEVDKIIQSQERLADVIFDVWLTNTNKKTA